jgi:hypothetical protein
VNFFAENSIIHIPHPPYSPHLALSDFSLFKNANGHHTPPDAALALLDLYNQKIG